MDTLIEIIKNKREQGIEWNFIEDLHKTYEEIEGRECSIKATYRKLKKAELKWKIIVSKLEEEKNGRGNPRLQYCLMTKKNKDFQDRKDIFRNRKKRKKCADKLYERW